VPCCSPPTRSRQTGQRRQRPDQRDLLLDGQFFGNAAGGCQRVHPLLLHRACAAPVRSLLPHLPDRRHLGHHQPARFHERQRPPRNHHHVRRPGAVAPNRQRSDVPAIDRQRRDRCPASRLAPARSPAPPSASTNRCSRNKPVLTAPSPATSASTPKSTRRSCARISATSPAGIRKSATSRSCACSRASRTSAAASGTASPGRIEAFFPAFAVPANKWSVWEGTYTIIDPLQSNIFQLFHEGGQLWAFHLRMTNTGTIYFARRRPIAGLAGQDRHRHQHDGQIHQLHGPRQWHQYEV
jgi:hypothetical protein